MWAKPTKADLERIPKLYFNEDKKIGLKDVKIYLHFFVGGCDWYIAEYDGEDIFWGYAILNGDYENAEWGYVSFSELKGLKVLIKNGIIPIEPKTSPLPLVLEVDTDKYWTVKKASEIENIKKGMGW